MHMFQLPAMESSKMNTYKDRETFLKEEGKLSYRELQTFARENDIKPRNVKREKLVELIGDYLMSQGRKTSEEKPAKEKEADKKSAGKRSAVKKSAEKKLPQRKAALEKQKAKALPRQKKLSRPSNGSRPSAPARSKEAECPPCEKEDIGICNKKCIEDAISPPQSPFNVTEVLAMPLSEALEYCLRYGQGEIIRAYLIDKQPSDADMKEAFGKVVLSEVSLYASYVYDPLGEFYAKLLRTSSSDPLAKQIFSAASRQNSSILFRLAHRESSLAVVGSRKYWKSFITQNVLDSAVDCFERTVLEGILDMEMYRGPSFRRDAMRLILEGISDAKVSSSRKSFFLYSLEELVGPNARIRGYSLEELVADTKDILGDVKYW